MKSSTRVRPCDKNEAKQRMARAREFLEVAELVVDEKDQDASIVYASSAASGDLRELLNLKDKAQYGFLAMSVPEVRKVMRRASQLVDFAAEVLRS